MKNLKDHKDYLGLVISRREIESQNHEKALTVLNGLLKGNETIEMFYERVDIAVDWYEDDHRELWEIPEVKQFLRILDNSFPYWFYFLTKFGEGLRLVTFCCIDTIKVSATQVTFNPDSMANFLNNHFVAMNEVCDRMEMSDQENKDLSDLVLAYYGL
ncbi:MAG TPA: hypothetical protein DHV28_17175 [Ignavibacteriales bacterium]|nr:hypothetical protein [Ignavibacteriales bacterium]